MARPIAEKTHEAVMMDESSMLSMACLVDFGLDTGDYEAKFGALQNAARNGATPDDFDEALGNSEKLTALVKKYGYNVVFQPTSWELMKELEEDG